MPGLKLCLLGRFRVFVDGLEIDPARLPRKTARLVIKLLALAPDRRLHREQLLDALSPEADRDGDLNRLHKAIHLARRGLEPNLEKVAQSRFVLTQEMMVLLDAETEIDVEEFERRAAEALSGTDAGQIEEVLSLYSGDLLEEDLYEDWAAAPRERLRLTRQRLLGALCAAYESAGDLRLIEAAGRLLAAYPADEEGHRRLMRFYAGRGERHLALDQFRQCTEALAQQLDASPEKSTVELYESILEGRYQGPVNPAEAVVVPAPATPAAGEAGGGSTKPAGIHWMRILAGFLIGAILTGLGVWWALSRNSRPGTVSLAILPFRSRPADPALEAIADGLTEELINSASRLPGLKVMARTTAFAYKARTDDWQVGRELKVTHVLYGAVDQQQAGQTVVDVELLDVSDGSRVWGRRYSIARRDTPSIQHLISSELAGALQIRPGGLRRASRSTSNEEAYRLYVTGRQSGNLRTPAGLRTAIQLYQKAIAADPDYALAYAGLADSYGLIGFQDGAPAEYFPLARDAAAKALALDPSLAEAQTSLAMVNALYAWDWPAAEAQFRQAIDMNPGYVTAHHWLGVHLAAMGRFAEARLELDKAAALDPRSAIVTLNTGYPALYERKYDEAAAIFRRSLAFSPAFAAAHEDLITIVELQGKPAEAALEFVSWLRDDGRTVLAERLRPKAQAGDYRQVLQESLEAFENPSPGEYISPMLPAVAAIRLGDRDRAFRWLEQAFAQRCPQLVYLAADPKYDPLRQDPRYRDLLRRVGLRNLSK